MIIGQRNSRSLFQFHTYLRKYKKHRINLSSSNSQQTILLCFSTVSVAIACIRLCLFIGLSMYMVCKHGTSKPVNYMLCQSSFYALRAKYFEVLYISTNFVATHSQYCVYLIYQQNLEYIK